MYNCILVHMDIYIYVFLYLCIFVYMYLYLYIYICININIMYVWVLSYNPLTKLHSTRQKRHFCAKFRGSSWGNMPYMNSTVLYDIPVLVVGIITCIEGIANSYHVGMRGFPTSISKRAVNRGPTLTFQRRRCYLVPEVNWPWVKIAADRHSHRCSVSVLT